MLRIMEETPIVVIDGSKEQTEGFPASDMDAAWPPICPRGSDDTTLYCTNRASGRRPATGLRSCFWLSLEDAMTGSPRRTDPSSRGAELASRRSRFDRSVESCGPPTSPARRRAARGSRQPPHLSERSSCAFPAFGGANRLPTLSRARNGRSVAEWLSPKRGDSM